MHASIAERFAYGTPIDPVVEEDRVHNRERSGTALVGRILLSAIFIISGIAKLMDPAGAVGYMKMSGVPSPDVLVWVAGIVELAGGLAILLGFLARLAALGLFIYLIVVSFYMHAFWNLDGAEAKTQMVQFVKNLAIMGGLLMLVASGPGQASIDARIRKPYEP